MARQTIGNTSDATSPRPSTSPVQSSGTRLPDPESDLPEGVDQSIQQPYIQNGLTYQSNNKFVMQRDTAGNIILDANADTIQHLIIEPAVEKILNKSVVEVFDTRFNYFKFPAKSKGIPSNAFALDFDLDTDAPAAEIQDLISGHYVAPFKLDSNDQPQSLSRHRLSYASTWKPGEGPLRIPFSVPISGPTQLEPGTFTITQEIIDTLQETNSTIKFRAHLLSLTNDISRNTGFYMQLVRSMPSEWRTRNEANGWPKSPSGQELFNLGYNNSPHVYKATDNAGVADAYPSLTLEYIIHPQDFREFDKYEIQAVSGGPSWWDRNYSFWDIDVIPDPGSGYGLQYDYSGTPEEQEAAQLAAAQLEEDTAAQAEVDAAAVAAYESGLDQNDRY